jgi:hypothetical protein
MTGEPTEGASPGPPNSTRIRELLDRIDVLRHPCDLDLLLFFHRHPRAFLTSEQLAGYAGYSLAQISDSLDVLIGAQLLRRSATQAQSAWMYYLLCGGPQGEWLESLLALAASREGQYQLRQALKVRSAEAPAGRARAKKPARAARRSLEAVHART